MAAMKTISAALKLVNVKKENLRKAFEDLQANSSSLLSLNLKWSDLDSYFTSLQSSLENEFEHLQSQEQHQSQPSQPSLNQPQPSSSIFLKDASDSAPVQARPDLISFCQKMDGLGLRDYIGERPRERTAIRVELPDAFRRSPDPAAMVLGAMEGFYAPNSKGDKELVAVRNGCVVLLEELMGVKPEIGAEVKERAKNLAAEWKGKVSVDGKNPLEALGFLHFLATYGLADCFNMEDLIDFAVIIARFSQTFQLCRVLGFGDRISDLILKLLSKGKRLLAVRFIYEFELTDKFPPVPLLKEYVRESKKVARKVWKGGKYSLQSEKASTANELTALKSVLKVIEAHKLESEFPKEKYIRRIETLEKLAERKRFESTAASQSQHLSQKLSGSKRPRTTAPSSPAAIPKSIAAASPSVPAFQQPHVQPAGLLPDHPAPYLSSPAEPYGFVGPAAIPKSIAAASPTVPTFQQPHLQPAGLLADHPAPYLSSSAGPYGLVGSTLGVAPYKGSSSGLYGSEGAPLGIPGNLTPTQPHIYPSETRTPSGYDWPIAYGGYGLTPQYHPSYNPQ